MKKLLQTILPEFIKKPLREARDQKEERVWLKAGCPVPPPHIVKQKTIKHYREKTGYKTLIETGTYLGGMIIAQINNFDKIISIEIDNKLYCRAVKKFKKYKHVHLYKGDSGIVLGDIMKEVNEPVIFWLDGHYSGGITSMAETECPIYKEISAIFSGSNFPHIILIDDARCFNGTNDYPTIDALFDYLKKINPNYTCKIESDIIRCTCPVN